MGRLGVLFPAFATFVVAAAVAQAVPLNLSPSYPDMLVTSNTVTYDAAVNLFTAKGRPLTFTITSPTAINITNTTTSAYMLTATIDEAGVASAGTLTVSGKIASLGATSGTLLTGMYQDFGYGTGPSGDPFEFIFSVTGGDLASYYGGIGGQIGVLIGAGSTGFAGFAGSFSNGSGATNDTFYVPEPVSLSLLALVGFVLRRRRSAC